MVPEGDLGEGEFRLLETTHKVIVPVDTHVRMVVTAADVIHSFAVPSLGMKIDALPGRLNQSSFIALREGTYYGQCSEICGSYHSFMPITIKAVSIGEYCAFVTATATVE